MNRNLLLVCLTIVGCVAMLVYGFGRPATTAAAVESSAAAQSRRLVVLWTSGDRDVATHMAFMYTRASKTAAWWDEVTLVVWGPSSKLLAEDEELQGAVKKMMAVGVKVQACVVCANMYGVADNLRDLGIEVKGMGKPLSEMLQSGWTLLSV